MNILVTLDRNYLPPLRVMLGSLLLERPRRRLLTSMPSATACCRRIGRGWTRSAPLGGASIRWRCRRDLFADAPVVRYYSRAMYYRLLAAELLPRTLWTGCCIWTRTFW